MQWLGGQGPLPPPYWQGAPGWLGWLDYHPSEQPGPLLEAEPQRPLANLLPICCVFSPPLRGGQWSLLWQEAQRGSHTGGHYCPQVELYPARIALSTFAVAPVGLAVKEPARDVLHLLPLF